VHVVQHLLVGMAAPLGFALAAPITLLLRVSGVRARRRIVAVLHTGPVRVLGWAPVAALLAVGPLWLLYLTPMYAATLRHPLLHDAVHLHMLLAGNLLAFAVVGRDPIPGCGGFGVRVATLVCAPAAHAILAKYLYVHATALAGPDVGTVGDWRLGAQLLWYGGDAVDALLVVAFFAQWYCATGRRWRHERRRLAPTAP
jgi:putative membrane protein